MQEVMQDIAGLTKAKYRPTGANFRSPVWKQDKTEFKLKMIRARRTKGKKYDHAKWMRRLKAKRLQSWRAWADKVIQAAVKSGEERNYRREAQAFGVTKPKPSLRQYLYALRTFLNGSWGSH